MTRGIRLGFVATEILGMVYDKKKGCDSGLVEVMA